MQATVIGLSKIIINCIIVKIHIRIWFSINQYYGIIFLEEI